MNLVEHIHIISAGESIHKTFPTAINEFKMDKVIIIVENEIFTNPNIGRNPLITTSINEVKTIADMLNKSFEIKYIPSISLENIRNAVLDIFNEHPKSNFYFNITGGTKILSNGLFMMSIWIGGVTYYVDESGSLQILTIPKIKIENIEKNPNFITLLETLSIYENKGILQKILFDKMKKEYKPIKEVNKISKRDLSRGTLSKWIQDLTSWGLITTEYVENSKKEKMIKLTDDGLFTLKFVKASNKRNAE